jgi:hypothetical protein
MAIFAHLCENFAGITPNTALFRHYFTPRVEKGEPLTVGVSWISRQGAKNQYLKGDLRPRWGEIRSEWCWIVDEDPPSFCEVRKTPAARVTHWGDLDPADKKLEIAVTRIWRLREAGLTIGMVGADFLRRRIAPLQQRGRPASDYKNPADIMRLRPGLVNNFTILQHDFIMHELFKRETDPEKIDKAFKLPKHIVPLRNNSALSAIIAVMPHCNAHSVEATWDVPPEEDVRRFFDTTVERPVREEKWLVRDTTESIAATARCSAPAPRPGAARHRPSAARSLGSTARRPD